MTKTDFGKDLEPGYVSVAFNCQKCPRCGGTATNLQSTDESQFTLTDKGKCYWQSGERADSGFVCNKVARDNAAKAAAARPPRPFWDPNFGKKK